MDDLSLSINQEKKIFFASIEAKIEENKKKLSEEPGNILILKELASLSGSVGMYDLSVYFSYEVLNYEPNSRSAILMCIKYLLLNGQELEAKELIQNILKKNITDKKNNSPEEIVQLIHIISKVFGDKETALLLAEKEIKKSPADKILMILDSHINQWFYGNMKKSRNILSKIIKKFSMELPVLNQWIDLYIRTESIKTLRLCKIFDRKYSEFKNVINKKLFLAYSFLGQKKDAEKYLNEINNNIEFMFHKISMHPDYIKELNIHELLKDFERNLLYAESFNLTQFNYPLALLSFVISKKYKSLNFYEKKNYFLDLSHKSIFKHHYYSEKNVLAVQSEMPDTLSKMSEIAEKKLQRIGLRKDLVSPIFIIGLPRSGSSLIEKIISDTNEIIPFGECQIVKKLIYNLTIKNSSPSLIELYKDEFKFLTNKQRFVDKTLNNFPFVSLILESFPNAKFVNCKRDSKENALAIYNILFDSIPWTHTMENILNYMDEYYKTMEKLNKKFSSNIYNIYHQDLVKNPQNEVSRLFKFLKIKYDPEVLNNQNDSLQVFTASNWQVRGKISSKFLKKYTKDYYLLNKFSGSYSWLK